MRKFLLLFVVCSFSFLVLLSLFIYFSIEQQPQVIRPVTVAPENIDGLKKIIDTHRYRVYPGMVATANLLPEDVDIAANYLVNHFVHGRAQIKLADQQALIQLSIPISEEIGYLNLRVTVLQTKSFPEFQSLRIGQVLLPDFVTKAMTTLFFQWLKKTPEFESVLDAIKLVQISPAQLRVTYLWNNNFSPEEVGISGLDKAAQARIYRYYTLLVRNSQTTENSEVSLAEVMSPLLRLAVQQKGDAVAENRALILVTAFHVLGLPIKQLIPDAASWPRPVHKIITIDGRNDLAKHFIVSAAITAYADTILSDAIGLYKEIEDARSGSGFSFNDIAADRAGTRFGEEATANPSIARQIQILASLGLKDTDIMPRWEDLPEFLSESEFKKQFGSIHTKAYREMMDKIEKRISNLRILSSSSGAKA